MKSNKKIVELFQKELEAEKEKSAKLQEEVDRLKKTVDALLKIVEGNKEDKPITTITWIPSYPSTYYPQTTYPSYYWTTCRSISTTSPNISSNGS